ncbi:MAG: response regulator [Nitrospirae bacterium]|nr:response regulator [Nitrospirota bacterium]
MGNRTKVLVVDDDQRMVRTICDILKVKGHEALAAYSGEEAVEKVRSDNPDCVLMDMKMPGLNGTETLSAIKALSPGLPVVLMSAYASEEQIACARQQGAYAVLAKPIDMGAIISFLSLLRKEDSVLIVDDDPGFCKTLGDVLTSRGYRVETEGDPNKVLGHMEQDYKLVVLLDLKLGNSDGLDVLKSIRTKYPTKPVVLVTGYKEDVGSSIEKGMKIGAYTCLYKPFAADVLIESIEEISIMKRSAVLEQIY